MKATITLFFALFIAATAFGNTKEVKVNTTMAAVTFEISITKKPVATQQMARLYFDKNSRVKKSLKFVTKKDTAKMA